MSTDDELVKAAREALPILESLVSRGSTTWLTDDLERIYSSLKAALPREYRCRDCQVTQAQFFKEYSPQGHKFTCSVCGQSGRWCDTETEALKAASKEVES